MAPEDIRVWEKFLGSPANVLERVDYDVRAGDPLPAPLGVSEALRRMWEVNQLLRIDAVGYVQDETWIIEVKPRLNTSGLGQLLCYTSLYRVDFSPVGRLDPVFVCEFDNAQLRPVYESFGVRVVVV